MRSVLLWLLASTLSFGFAFGLCLCFSFPNYNEANEVKNQTYYSPACSSRSLQRGLCLSVVIVIFVTVVALLFLFRGFHTFCCFFLLSFSSALSDPFALSYPSAFSSPVCLSYPSVFFHPFCLRKTTQTHGILPVLRRSYAKFFLNSKVSRPQTLNVFIPVPFLSRNWRPLLVQQRL